MDATSLVVIAMRIVIQAPGNGLNHDICLMGAAGLLDRKYIYSRMSDFVSQTNSTLWIPAKPCHAFDWKTHNTISLRNNSMMEMLTGNAHYNKLLMATTVPLPCSTVWSDYLALPHNVRPIQTSGLVAPSNRQILSSGKCHVLRNSEAYALVKAHNFKRTANVALNCKQFEPLYRSLREAPFAFAHVRRGDVINRKHNEWLTSAGNVASTMQTAYKKLRYTALLYVLPCSLLCLPSHAHASRRPCAMLY